jgi:uncharacterized protein (DUF1330 family)
MRSLISGDMELIDGGGATNMSAFVIGMYDIWDQGWREAYRDKTIALAAKHGGKILVRPNCAWRLLEGKAPCRTGVVMFEFPSVTAAEAWYNDPDYAPLKKIRQSGANLDLIVVESLKA